MHVNVREEQDRVAGPFEEIWVRYIPLAQGPLSIAGPAPLLSVLGSAVKAIVVRSGDCANCRTL